jgi:aminoglycoside phosphotransferase (APT) family kinase protein
MPPAEVDVSPELARRLLASQHPDLADRAITVLANGWDNVICRLGADLLIRLPRRAMAADLVLHEQRWLPVLAPRLPLAVPVPTRVGRPGEGYPWAWSVVPFLPGRVAARTELSRPRTAAAVLGRFLNALHTEAPPDAPRNPVRGVPLGERNDTVLGNVTVLADIIDTGAVMRRWQAALAVPAWPGPGLWLHGDLHSANILVHRGELSAVIDFGDITAGDPATDLAVAWMLFPDPGDRDRFWAAYGRAGADTVARAEGWALAFSLVYQAHSADNPLMAEIGRRTMAAILLALLTLQPERLGYLSGQGILGHRGVDSDSCQLQARRLLAEAFGEHPISLEQVVQGLIGVAGLTGDLPQRATAVERGPAELGRREQPDGVTGPGQQRLDQVRQQPEPLGDHRMFAPHEVLGDQVEALASEPVERLQHGLR